MSPYAKFGLDWPSRSAGHWQHTYRLTDRHNALYYVDFCFLTCNSHAFVDWRQISDTLLWVSYVIHTGIATLTFQGHVTS